MRRIASCARPDSPTTSMSPSCFKQVLSPRRTTSWSSSRKTRIFVEWAASSFVHAVQASQRRRAAFTVEAPQSSGTLVLGPRAHRTQDWLLGTRQRTIVPATGAGLDRRKYRPATPLAP